MSQRIQGHVGQRMRQQGEVIMTRKITIATRGSALALWQANTVCSLLSRRFPEHDFEVHVIKTTGDVTLDKPLHEIGDKGMFTKELEGALLDGEADLCVHSMKDVPSMLPDACMLSAMLPRADVRDALVCGPRFEGVHSLAELPAGTRIGTGSLRRTAQLHARFPELEVLGIRGNVDTRIRKAYGDEYDGAILAAAGMTRMGEAGKIAGYIPIEEMVPAAGQGAIGIEVRRDDTEILELTSTIGDAVTCACVNAERHILAALGGSCKVPIGAHARFEGGQLVLDAVVLSLDGSRAARSHRTGDAAGAPDDGRVDLDDLALDLAREALADLESQQARGILADILEEEGIVHV